MKKVYMKNFFANLANDIKILLLSMIKIIISNIKRYIRISFYFVFKSLKHLFYTRKIIKLSILFNTKFSFLGKTLKKIFLLIKSALKKISKLFYDYITVDRISPFLNHLVLKYHKLKESYNTYSFFYRIFLFIFIFSVGLSIFILSLFPTKFLRRVLNFSSYIVRRLFNIKFRKTIKKTIVLINLFVHVFLEKLIFILLPFIKLFFSFISFIRSLIIKYISRLKVKIKFLNYIVHFLFNYFLKKRLLFYSYIKRLFFTNFAFFNLSKYFLRLLKKLSIKEYQRLKYLIKKLNKLGYIKHFIVFIFAFIFLHVFLLKTPFLLLTRILKVVFSFNNYIIKFFASKILNIYYIFSSFINFLFNRVVRINHILNSLDLLIFLRNFILKLKLRVKSYNKYFLFFIFILRSVLNYLKSKVIYTFSKVKKLKHIFLFVNILWLIKPFIKLLNNFLNFLYFLILKIKIFITRFLFTFTNILLAFFIKNILKVLFKKNRDIEFRINTFKNRLSLFLNKRIGFSLNLFKKKLIFIKIIGFANWVKHGYFVSIFLIVSLLGFSFNAISYYNKKPSFNHGDITICYDKIDINNISLNFDNFKKIDDCKNATVVITDRFSNNSIVLKIDAPIIVGPKSIHNISYKELIAGFKNGYIKDYKVFITKRAKEKFFKNYDIKVSDIIDSNNFVYVISFDELETEMNVVMIDGYYPSRSMILNRFYPFSEVVVAKINNEFDSLKKMFKEQDYMNSIILGGDIMFDRGVRSKIESNGYYYIIEDLVKIFSTGNISFANLECPISDRGSKFNLEKGIFFRCSPDNARIIKEMGINIVSLANNHILDYGLTAALDTINYLNKEGIFYSGMGLDREESLLSPVLNIGDKRVRILSYNNIYPYSYNAEENVPGLLILNKSNIEADIKKAKEGVDYLFVSIHTGEEFIVYPENDKINLFRQIIDMGADGIIGGHPHTFQPFEIYKGKFIFYSLGNLIFDQYRLGKNLQEQLVIEINFYKGKIKHIYPHFFKVNEDLKPVYVKGDSDYYLYLAERARMEYSKQIVKREEK